MIRNRYKIEKTLGEGGMGRVYLAKDIKENRPVAVKRIEHSENSATKFKRLTREYKFLSTVDHASIVKCYDLFEENQDLYLVLEWVDGVTLEEAIRSQKLSLADKLGIACQIIKGIEILHQAGIIHRDIKPANVMLDLKKHNAKILDLGIGKATNIEQSQLTELGAVIGTPDYMSPEQICGQQASLASDIFSLGTLLYQLFLSLFHSPFHGKTVLVVANNIVHKSLPLLSDEIEESETVYQEISEILQKALIKDSKQRDLNIRQFYSAVEKIYSNHMSNEKSLWKTPEDFTKEFIDEPP